MDQVRIVNRKYDGSLHWNQPGWRLGEDEHGVWVGGPAGTPVRRGHDPGMPAEAAHVVLFPRDGWWTRVHPESLQRQEQDILLPGI